MDRLSIYELLSFMIPGYVGVKVIEYYFHLYGIVMPNPLDSNFEDSIFLFIIAIVIGLAVHVLTFKLINYKWFQALVFQPVEDYIENSKLGELQVIIPAIKAHYTRDKQHLDDVFSSIEESKTFGYKWAFDYAYYYLEVNNKISQAKNFQSFYFLFRNLFSISLLHFLILGILAIIGLIIPLTVNIFNWKTLAMVVILALLTWLVVIIARWLRGKMIDRVFWNYYVDRRIKEIDNKINK